jgi:phosphoglycolate phosphatase
MARVVFDLDGTLVDSAPDLHAVANSLLEAHGQPPITLTEARSFIGQGVAVFVAKLRAARGIPESGQARLLAGFLARYESAVELTITYPGVEAALQDLRGQGHRIAICTNKPMAPTLSLLRHLDLLGYFDKIIAGDSLPTRKPDPAPLLAACDMSGKGPNLYVGDSEVDAETAERAGIPLYLFTQGYRTTPVEKLPHRATFDDFANLPALLAAADP